MIVRLHNTIFITTNIINQNNMFRREPLSGSRFALLNYKIKRIVMYMYLSYR
jgi:hypothetical protein